MNIVKRGIAVTEAAPAPSAADTNRSQLDPAARFHQRSRFGGKDPEPSAPTALHGERLHHVRSRYGGFDSAEAQRAARDAERAALIGTDGAPESLSAEATLARVTVAPPAYGRQAPTAAPLPRASAPGGAPVAPTAAESLARASSGPPYQLTRGSDLRGAQLMNFRSRFGRDPEPNEQVDPNVVGGAA